MSQVLAAKAASAASPPAREAPTSGRKGEVFAALFERMKASRRERQAPIDTGRAGRPEPEGRSGRAGAQKRPESARPEPLDEGSATRSGRAERLQGEGREARPAELREKSQTGSENEMLQDAASQAASSKRVVEQDAQESSHHEPEQTQGGQGTVGQEKQAGSESGGPTTENAQVGTVIDAGQRVTVGSAPMPAGFSQHVPGGSISVPAQAPGSPDGSSPVVPQAAGQQGLQPTAAIPPAGAGSRAESDETLGEAAEVEGKSAAGTQNQAKASQAGESFQAVLSHAGRGRGIAQPHRAGMTSAAGVVQSSEKPIELNGPAGTEELAQVVRAKVGARHSAMMIRLDPPELGRVQVDVKMHQDVLTLRFQAETEAGHDALAGRIRELTGALEGQGIRLDRVEVEYRPPPDGQRDEQSSQQHGGQEWKEPRHAGEHGQPEPRREHAFSHQPGAGSFSSAVGLQDQADSSAVAGVDLVV